MLRQVAAVLDLRPGALYQQKGRPEYRAEIVGLALCCRTLQELVVYTDSTLGLLACPVHDFSLHWEQEKPEPVPEKVLDYRLKGRGA